MPCRESIVRAEEMNPPRDANLGRGHVEVQTTSKQVTVRLQVRPLPAPVTEFLVKHTGAIKRLYSERQAQEQERVQNADDEDDDTNAHDVDAENTTAEGGQILSMEEFKKRLNEAFAEEKTDKEVWKGAVEKIVAFGPRRIGPNVVIDATEGSICGKL